MATPYKATIQYTEVYCILYREVSHRIQKYLYDTKKIEKKEKPETKTKGERVH